ncbi:Cell polarity protein mor2, partial [Dissostichus eleginoides]
SLPGSKQKGIKQLQTKVSAQLGILSSHKVLLQRPSVTFTGLSSSSPPTRGQWGLVSQRWATQGKCNSLPLVGDQKGRHSAHAALPTAKKMTSCESRGQLLCMMEK